jgi:hypothetical protein
MLKTSFSTLFDVGLGSNGIAKQGGTPRNGACRPVSICLSAFYDYLFAGNAKMNILCAADIAPQTDDILGIPVIGAAELSGYDKNIPIVITLGKYSLAIAEALTALGFRKLYYYNSMNCHEARGAAALPDYDEAEFSDQAQAIGRLLAALSRRGVPQSLLDEAARELAPA